ncbi:MAG: T9SS C-terminal target domain-containing protein [Haliscomenobacteraceae bacterium CHB4]|nr:T9SS C-terminal target domain-containing protein [Haliscomenobacteraceae bacterium CHB4]
MKHNLLLAFLAAGCFFPADAQFNWEHTGGPNGGSLSSIWSNDDFAFYADEFFLYRTSDGIIWEKFPENSIWPLATHGGILVGQFYPDNSLAYNLPTILKISYDNGETWNEISKPPVSFISRIAICSHGIYVPQGAQHIIHRSQDEGVTWDTMTPPFQYGYDVWAFDDRLYSSNLTQIWRTDTNGENWTSVTPPLASGEYIRGLFAHGQHVIVATEENLWHSHDDGQTWGSHSTPWPHFYEEFTLVGNDVFGTGGTTGIAKSTDFGVTWQELPVPPYNLSIFDLATAGGKALAITYSKGVFRWEESEQALIESNNGLGSAVVAALADGGNKIWAGTGNGVFAYDKQQQTWTTNSPLPLPSYYYEIVAANDDGLVCAAQTYREYIYLSKDGGLSWDSIYPSQDPWSFGYIEGIKVLDDVIFVDIEFGKTYRSGDLGQTWHLVADNVHNIVKFNDLFIGCNWQNQILASSDKGITWNVLTDFTIGDIVQLFVADDRLFLSAYVQSPDFWRNLIYTSLDGIDWKYAHDGLPDGFYGFDPDTYERTDFFGYEGKYYLFKTSLGFYASIDSCKTWLPVGGGRGSQVVLADSLFYVGGFGGGVLRSGIPDVYGVLASGTVYKDDNNNGIRDNGENVIPNVHIGLHAPNAWFPFYMTATDATGMYALGITSGTVDTLRPLFQSNYLESVNPPYHLAADGGNNLDFGIKLTPNINDLAVAGNYAGRPRPGFDLSLIVNYKNAGTTEPSDAAVSVKLDNNFTYINAVPPPTAVFGDSLVWSLAQLLVFDGGNIKINMNLPVTTPLGTVVKSVCRIQTAASDLTPDDNLRIVCDTVVGSYDPNEKRVEPADGLTAAEIAAGKEILYTVHFQNTGTYLAERVRITDLLDTALYLPSLRFVAASHEITSFRLNPGGLLEVIFDNIMLPDSNSNEPASHGFVTFAVQRKKSFNPHYPVSNDAAIYFDFNEPILTNMVTTPVKTVSVSVKDLDEKQGQQLLIYPNPAQHQFMVSAEGQLSGQGSLILQNTAGQICQQFRVADLSLPITVQTANLPDGIYILRLSGSDKAMGGLVMVQRN